MSGGEQTMVINPSERAVSIDVMRMQRFRGLDAMELWRILGDTFEGTDDFDSGGNASTFSSQENPLRGEIFGGLMVKPQISSLDLLVDPGIACVIDPDSPQISDESVYKYLRDPGVPSAGTLAMTGNATGSIRIDVVECARVAAPGYAVLETDNRDIFNQTTGLFSAATVNKVVAGRMQYRVRAGTSGGGWPGTAQGWMPLMVALVPPGAANNDTMTFWDVRPLITDRDLFPSYKNRAYIHPKTVEAFAPDDQAGAPFANMPLAGIIETTSRNGVRRLGGVLRRGSPGTDADLITLTDVANRQSGFAPTDWWYLYFVEPFGLPRWARYTDASSGARKPRSPRGIPIVSHVAPAANGIASNSIPFPTAFGFSGSALASESVFALGGPFKTAHLKGALAAKGEVIYGNTGSPGTGLPTSFVVASGISGDNFYVGQFTLPADGVAWPACATAVLVEIAFTAHNPGGSPDDGSGRLNVMQGNPGTTAQATIGVGFSFASNAIGAASNVKGGFRIWVPLTTSFPGSSRASTYLEVTRDGGGSGIQFQTATASIVGYRY